MATPQSAILPEAGTHGLFLIAHVKGDSKSVVINCVALPDLIQKLQQEYDAADLVASIAFGASYWQQISPDCKPEELQSFTAKGQAGIHAPATGGDIFLHVHSNRKDLNYQLAREFIVPIQGELEILDEVHGFHYLDERDLTGFIDGTENPEGEERSGVALIDKGVFAAGSYVLTQRYVHNLNKWQKVEESEQEKIIGRTKQDSVELDEDTMPDTSHVSRVVIEEGGEELEILRHSMPYGDASGDAGLFFLAYNKDISTYEKMLNNMFGNSGDGLHDHLMNYSSAKTGAYFFAPSLENLRDLA